MITFRRVSVNLHRYQCTSGSCICSVCFFVRLDTEWPPTRLRLLQEMNVGTLRFEITWSCQGEKTIGFLLTHFWSFDGCHNDSWSLWTYHSEYKRNTHTKSVLHWVPQPDGVLNNTTKDTSLSSVIQRLHQDCPDPIVFLSVVVNTSGHVYDDFVLLIFLHTHRETRITWRIWVVSLLSRYTLDKIIRVL